MEIEYMKLKDLKPYKKNAKLHPEYQLEQIKKSIQDFGFNDPIAIDANNVIIEGHGRYLAAKELKLKTVPVIRLDLNDDARKAYGLVHNKLTMNTGFDFDNLMGELETLSVDMEQYGFEAEEEENNYTIENREYSAEDFDDEKFEYECPECGFRFNA